jgi:hypothetical protein
MSGEPANFSIEDAARWRSKRPRKSPAGPRPTLAELRATTSWFWVICNRCPHRAPMAFVPLMIRWGGDTSSDKLRSCARCTACGNRGATIQHPGWVDISVGFQPFPTSSDAANVLQNAARG